jgi:rubrerythrin
MRDQTQDIRHIREALEQVHERLGVIIARLRPREEPRYMRWRCTACGHLKHFTRPMPAEVAPPCPKCKGASFQPMP